MLVFALVCVAIILAGHLAFIGFWMSCYCKCLVALSRGAAGRSAICAMIVVSPRGGGGVTRG